MLYSRIRIRRLSIVICLIFLLKIIVGCSKAEKPDFIWGNDMIHIDYALEADSVMFRIPFLYRTEKENPVFVAVTGKGLENLEIIIKEDETIAHVVEDAEKIADMKKRGYQLSALQVEVRSIPQNTEVQIDSLTVQIAGKEETLLFEQPLRIKTSVSPYDPINAWYMVPSICFGGEEQSFSYRGEVGEDTILESVSYSNFYRMEECSIMVKRGETYLEGTFPLALMKGDVVTFNVTISLPEEKAYDLHMVNFELFFSEGKHMWVTLKQAICGSPQAAEWVFQELLSRVEY